MSAAPLAIEELEGGSLKKGDILISGCIVCHVLAMFLPGFVTGDVIQKVGVFPVMITGLLLQGAANIVMIANHSLASFYVGLILLGLGFNCAFTSGTLLLIRSHSLEERARVTSVNETLRFTANACGILLSSSLRWEVLNLICFVLVIILFPVLLMARGAART